MTIALGRKVNIAMPEYRRGCKPGHKRLEFVRGECFTCGRHDPPVFQLDRSALEQEARKRYAKTHDGMAQLEDAIVQTQLKLRALALLDDIDIDNRRQYRGWLRIQKDAVETVDKRLRQYDEDEVRWALRGAYT